MCDDEYFMKLALEQAKFADIEDEIPVGAVIVKDNVVIAAAYNQKDKEKLVTRHAELLAIEKASAKLNDWRLNDTIIYVTLEPCPMCASAIQQARINKVVYGCDSNITDNRQIIEQILQNKEKEIKYKTVIISIKNKEILDVLNYDTKVILKLNMEQVNYVEDKDGNVISGSKDKIDNIEETWTFIKKDQMWLLDSIE